MIDPVIFTIGGFSLRWYGVIVMLGVIVGSLYVENELKRHGENSDRIWDALVWILPIGIIGARLWFVLNATLGGNRFYIENPSHILKIWEGGLHIYGGLLLGAIAMIYYLRRNKLDVWLFFDAAGPALLIGQAIGRIANFINQELYGPPTTLPWGLKIEAVHRLTAYQNLSLYPVDTTRFHPTFAYEMIWNFATAGLLIWLSRRYEKEFKPGTVFAGWLMAAGLGRTWLELFFRPDQPKIGDSFISYSLVAAALMAVAGIILLMARYKAINLPFAENWEDEYKISGQEKLLEEEIEPIVMEEEPVVPVKKVSRAKAKIDTDEKVVKKPAARKKTASTTPKKTATKTTKKATATKTTKKVTTTKTKKSS